MAIEQARQFIAEIATNEKAQELLKAAGEFASEGEAIQAYRKVAAEIGYDLSTEDMAAVIGELKQKQAAKTAQAREAAEGEALDDVELQNVAGGMCGDALHMIQDAQEIHEKCSDILNAVEESGKNLVCGLIIWS